ncbi:hypothetical protein BJV82DRAFT_606282 [Fennellomyces sp. T-0311]|nr:hypothetical protein BJV82DRAFT_606282 [Fennellomyces sp. T-0311]
MIPEIQENQSPGFTALILTEADKTESQQHVSEDEALVLLRDMMLDSERPAAADHVIMDELDNYMDEEEDDGNGLSPEDENGIIDFERSKENEDKVIDTVVRQYLLEIQKDIPEAYKQKTFWVEPPEPFFVCAKSWSLHRYTILAYFLASLSTFRFEMRKERM